MKIEVVNSMEKLMPYKAEWESILKEMNNDIMYLELDWIVYWWKFFGFKYDLLVLIIINDQEVLGICPLMITNRVICNEIGFIGGRESSSMDFILRTKYREEAIECLCSFLRNLKKSNIIKLHGISEKSASYTLIKRYLTVNKVPFISSRIINYFIKLKENDFNTHFINRFGKTTRQTMNNKEKKLEKLGKLGYKRISSSEIDEVFEIHDKRWLRKVGNSSFSKGDTKEFYKELALNKNMQFNLTVDAITLNNKIISFIYASEYNGKILLIRVAHDDDFYFLSPGELMFKKKIEECFLSQMSVVDFGPGYEPYKDRWTDEHQEVFTLILPSNSLQSNLILYTKYLIKIKVINALKKNKRIYNYKKYSLGKIKFLLSRECISNKIFKIKRNVHQNGIRVYLIKTFSGLTSKIFSYKQYLIFGKYLKDVEISQSNLHVREATIDDLDLLTEVMNISLSKIIRRFTNKHKCFITLHDSKVIYYCWINCANFEVSSIELNIPLGNPGVHIYDTFMKKEYKDESNYTDVLSNVFNFLYKENYRRCYITLNSCDKSFENQIYKRIFHPSYKVLEKKIFGTIKHSIVDLKLSDKNRGNIFRV